MEMGMKKNIKSNLKEHFSRKIEFSILKTRPEIKFKFKKDRLNIKGRIYLEDKKVEYESYGTEYKYTFNSDKYPQEFLTSFIVFYPNPLSGDNKKFDEWVSKWMHDKRKRNKPARELYNYEGES